MSIPNLLPLIERERAKFPDALLNAEQVGQLMYNIARAAGPDWGLLLKPHGHGVPSPIGRISQDVLVHIPEEQEYDALESADGPDHSPGPAIPTWNKLPFKVGVPPSGASMDRVRRPIGSVPVPTPEPAPQKPADQSPEKPQPCQCAEVVEMLTAMELRAESRHDAVLTILRRLQNAHRAPRKVHGKAGWMSISGQVDGVAVE